MDHEMLLNCLVNRFSWYQKAIFIKQDNIPYENGFDFPDGNIDNWEGARKELINTIAMLTAKTYQQNNDQMEL